VDALTHGLFSPTTTPTPANREDREGESVSNNREVTYPLPSSSSEPGRTGKETGKEYTDSEIPGPMAPAHRAYQEAIEDIARIWDGQKASGKEPPRLDSAAEKALDDDIAACFQAKDLPGSLQAIDRWRDAWLEILCPQTKVTENQARRLNPTHLFRLVDDPEVPLEEQEIYRREIYRRVDLIIEEYEAKRPHPNMGVHDMFQRRSGGYPNCGTHRHWRSTSGVVICGICHPPAQPSLVEEWIDERGTEAQRGGG